MNNLFFFLKKNQVFLHIIAFLLVLLDILISRYYNYPVRLFINYILIPGLIYMSLLIKHRSYFALLLYEIIISFFTFYDLIGFSFFTYFWIPDLWSIFNMLRIDATIINLPIWFQPILVDVFFLILALMTRRKIKSQ